MRRALKDQLAEIGVVEQIPRGWGGDDKWRVRAARSLPDADGPALSIHRTQREAFAAAIRTFV
jgi:hypothetical protein